MNDSFDIFTLLILVVAIVIFLRLRSVLGRRTGHEKPRYDPFTNGNGAPAPENVIPMPAGSPRTAFEGESLKSAEERLGKFASKGTPLAGGLLDIARADQNFDPAKFLEGAKIAYETIVTAFAAGNRKLLKPLLGREVYEGFNSAISAREAKGETVEFSFIGISKAEIASAELAGRMAQVTVHFISELITATHGPGGAITEGDPKRIREVSDIWTFARDTTSRDPNWKLIATETAA